MLIKIDVLNVYAASFGLPFGIGKPLLYPLRDPPPHLCQLLLLLMWKLLPLELSLRPTLVVAPPVPPNCVTETSPRLCVWHMLD